MAISPSVTQITFKACGSCLDCFVIQSAQDMLGDYGYNILEYTILTKMFAQVCGYKAVNLVYFMIDCYVYDRQTAALEDIICRTPYKAPKFYLNEEVTDFYKFTRHCWQMLNYHTHPAVDGLQSVISG